MVYSGAYAVVLVLHLLTTVFLVGPAAVAAVHAPRQVRAGRVDALRAASRTTRLSAQASVLTVLLGSAMLGLGDVGGQWEFTQAWVLASYALWLLAVGVTLTVVVQAEEAAVEALDAGRDAGHLAGRIALGGRIAMLAWTAIVVLMVLKPGA